MIPAIDGRAITVQRRGRAILDDVELTVTAGDWCTVIGPNGAGKSTLLAAVAGITAHAGQVRIHGVAIEGLDPRSRARLIACVVQQPVVPRGIDVDDYVLLGRTAYADRLGRVGAADREAAWRALERLGLAHLRGRRLDTLSGGERQLAIIARAIAQATPLLLLDEPTTALDIGFQQDVLDVIDGLRHELGLTVLSVMHDLTLCSQYADQLVLLDAGRVVRAGDPLEILEVTALGSTFGARLDVITHNGRTIVAPRRRPTITGGAVARATRPSRQLEQP